jgi:hypothetical protein
MGYLGIIHGLYNVVVLTLLLRQAWLGLRIRRQRLYGGLPVFDAIKKHRKLGPILVILGLFGFLSGLVTVYMDYGTVTKYPYHLLTGSLVALLLITAFWMSRIIKGGDSPWRTRHYAIGVIILCTYVAQMILGLDILF